MIWWINCLPSPLFRAPLASELLDRDGRLLSAVIAADGQWRMPAADSVDGRLRTAIVSFEDRRFYRHLGIDPVAIARATRANLRAGSVVSGGSTLTMQVARMVRGIRNRSLYQKVIEGLVALRLESVYSKEEILSLWLDNAPFGGNVVGVEAACRRYFGRSPADLSWAEAATLAVLPNSPGLIHPGRNRHALRQKRNELLRTLLLDQKLTREAYELALLEPIPDAPLALPRLAPHLLQRLRQAQGGGGGRIQTQIIASLQEQVGTIVQSAHRQLSANGIHNLAVLISDVSTGEVIAYHGNVPGLAADFAPDVDLITAPRSPGSVLKPLLYGLALDAGELLPTQFLPDVPMSFQNFRPTNFNPEFDGAVPADEALARSLNIPFVFLLRDFGVPRFHTALRTVGFAQMTREPGHYGLSLILGGAEITMEEIHAWYLGVARQLRFYDARRQQNLPTTFGGMSAGAAYSVLEALRELNRPDETGAYQQFESERPVAWKTGTSFGLRDAWAVGCTPAYTVTVWAGNADGEGRPGLVGVKAAAPVLFRVLRILESYDTASPRWFERPYDDLAPTTVCRITGYLSGRDCPQRTVWAPLRAERAGICPRHRPVTVTMDQTYRTTLSCDPQAVTLPYLLLPPLQAHFYRRKHAEYRTLPPWQPGCESSGPSEPVMQVVYPDGSGNLSQTKNWEGELQPLHFEVAHHDPDAVVYWHLDGEYQTSTRTYHHFSASLSPGEHQLTLVDGYGNRLIRSYRVR
ncbi:penicillin-binding protein 1C [Lewinella aquimaris]|uniref:peptidoglycan glycosyltransferase n=1 Tax=Neolewinella aquimaris TaxID=1835722 RepID=A0A840E9U7_9BACT|nr:penicillin-binding protein 1C [Neolewinella aquimaris]MBB4077796.1 penicillin-binding protein 1C [Neolewinella aquimaris]